MNRKRPVVLLARGTERFDRGLSLLAGICLLSASACGDPPAPLDLGLRDSGGDEPEMEDSTDPVAADPDAPDARDTGADEVEVDDEDDAGGEQMPLDAGVVEQDASSTVISDAGIPLVISPPTEVKDALCSSAYDSVQLMYSTITRGSWQANPGGTFLKLNAPGYPCNAFLQEKQTRPAINDIKWTDAVDGSFLGFSEPSSISTIDYSEAQFRYFRSFIFVPKGANLQMLSVRAMGIDDSVYLELTNSRYPKGLSPLDVGPSDPAVGACQGNGTGEWNLAKYMAEGEINQLLLVHADLAAATSTLMSVDIRADGAPIQLVSCKK